MKIARFLARLSEPAHSGERPASKLEPQSETDPRRARSRQPIDLSTCGFLDRRNSDDGPTSSAITTPAPYAKYRFGVDVDDIEPGYDFGTDPMELIPPLRAGYRVDLGSDPKAILIVRDGETVALEKGRWSRLSRRARGADIALVQINDVGDLCPELTDWQPCWIADRLCRYAWT